ncbi:MAG: hypothetical protein ACETVN_01010 [Asgard group archaeon]
MKRDASGRLHVKCVIWGPQLSGKSTIFNVLLSRMERAVSQNSIIKTSTEFGKTMMFDYAPLRLSENVVIDLYTTGGASLFYALRRMILQDSDCVIFLADTLRNAAEKNVESLRELRAYLHQLKINPKILFLLNQRGDVVEPITRFEFIQKLGDLGIYGPDVYEVSATMGLGVFEAFKMMMKKTLKKEEEPKKVEIIEEKPFIIPETIPLEEKPFETKIEYPSPITAETEKPIIKEDEEILPELSPIKRSKLIILRRLKKRLETQLYSADKYLKITPKELDEIRTQLKEIEAEEATLLYGK